MSSVDLSTKNWPDCIHKAELDVFHLADEGREPRTVCGYSMSSGSTFACKADFTLVNKDREESIVPDFDFHLSVGLTGVVDTEGVDNFTLRFRVVDYTAQLDGSKLPSLVGLTGTVFRSAQGIARKVVWVPSGLMATEQIEQLTAVVTQGVPILPEKAIGVGAIWFVGRHFMISSRVVLQRTKVEVLSIAEGVLVTSNTIEQFVVGEGFRQTGWGKCVLDPTLAFPVRAFGSVGCAAGSAICTVEVDWRTEKSLKSQNERP